MAQILAAAVYYEGNGLASGIGMFGASFLVLLALFCRASSRTTQAVSITVLACLLLVAATGWLTEVRRRWSPLPLCIPRWVRRAKATVLVGFFSLASLGTFVVELQRQLCVEDAFSYVSCTYNGSLAAFSMISLIFGVHPQPSADACTRVHVWGGAE